MGIGNIAGACQAWNGVVSNASLVSMTTVPGKHPAHGKTVCGKSLNTIRNTSGQCPARSVVGMVGMTVRAFERMTNGNSVYTGNVLWCMSRGGFACIGSAACRYAGKP